jgi:hypothetical protein
MSFRAEIDAILGAIMDTRDPEGERRRLINLYARMTDGELEELASDPTTLTDTAYSALLNEIKQRGLVFDSAPSQPIVEDREFPELVSICRLRLMSEAIVAKGVLDSAGIECYLYDDRNALIDDSMVNLSSIPLMSHTFREIRGIDLKVKAEDAEEAMEILDHPTDDPARNEE